MGWKCPACGYSPSADVSMEAKALVAERPEQVEKAMRQAVKLVNDYMYNGKMPKYFINQFIYGIDMSSDQNVLRGIRLFLDKKYYKQNRNLAYLAGIIRNINNTEESEKKAERVRYGLNPPEIKKEK